MKKITIRIPIALCFLFLTFLVFNQAMMAEKAESSPEFKEMKSVKVKKCKETRHSFKSTPETSFKINTKNGSNNNYPQKDSYADG